MPRNSQPGELSSARGRRHAGTLGILLARRVDSSSLAVLRLSSLRPEGDEAMPSCASSSMSSWLCRLGSRGRRWLFLSDQFPTRREWLLAFEGSCGNKDSMSSSLGSTCGTWCHTLPPVTERWLHRDTAPGEPPLCRMRVKVTVKGTGVNLQDFKGQRNSTISDLLHFHYILPVL